MSKSIWNFSRALILLAACCAAPLALAAEDKVRPAAAASKAEPKIAVDSLNDYLWFFYAGRDPDAPAADDWVAGAAMKLGVGIYVIHQGNEALVYDTMTSLEQAGWIRNYLEKQGIKQITVVQSHWHLDHIAGNGAFQDRDIVALDVTRDIMEEKKAAIEAGKEWGEPAINPLILPNIAFHEKLEMRVGSIKIELHHFNIHTRDANLLYLPADKIMLTGDTLEDPITYMVEEEVPHLRTHLEGLQRLKTMDIAKIYPNHGDPAVIRKGGYDKTFIDATSDYITQMLARVNEPGYLDSKMEDFIAPSLAKGWVHVWPPYQEVHKANVKFVHAHYKDKPAR